MKKINLGYGLTLKAKINKEDETLMVSIYNKQSKKEYNSNNLQICTCEFCGEKFVSQFKEKMCCSCLQKFVDITLEKAREKSNNKPKRVKEHKEKSKPTKEHKEKESDNLPPRYAYNLLAPYIKRWTNYDVLSKKINIKRHTMVCYVYELNKAGLIEIKKINNVKYFRLKKNAGENNG